ncbi:hypothetical protein BGY98DRAFT_998688 [Russula aff. rugulosa BPL654]|nr:hypothetical protein BGY98DRAFT_998688 [Russula aff. rugulosa BPL654]
MKNRFVAITVITMVNVRLTWSWSYGTVNRSRANSESGVRSASVLRVDFWRAQVCVVHTLQLPRERIRRIEWQMAVRNENLQSPAATRRQHSALKEGRCKRILELSGSGV